MKGNSEFNWDKNLTSIPQSIKKHWVTAFEDVLKHPDGAVLFYPGTINTVFYLIWTIIFNYKYLIWIFDDT